MAERPPASTGNVDQRIVRDFGEEWTRFDQSALRPDEAETLFGQYFSLFPWSLLRSDPVGFDLGCGSGRWARFVAPRVGRLHCVDPSRAIESARRNLAAYGNVEFHQVGVDELPFGDATMDFGYSLGVLHHLPDTQKGLTRCVRCLKRGAPFLLYLYYALDNRPAWYRWVWRLSDALRHVISGLPSSLRYGVTQAIAAAVYWPTARLARLGERLGLSVEHWPLSAYRSRSFYVMRTDALDSFGTTLERRFTRTQIAGMMAAAGLTDIHFREAAPFWCALGVRS